MNRTTIACIFIAQFLVNNTFAQGLQSLQKLSEKPVKAEQATQKQIANTHGNEEDLLRNEFQSSSEANLSNFNSIFENEILTFSKYFMAGGLDIVIDSPNAVQDDHAEVVVDRDLLWNYLKFSSNLFEATEGNGLTSLCIAVRPEQNCMLCESAKNSISNGLQESFKRRGFIFKPAPQFQAPLQIQSSSRGEKAVEELQARIASSKLEGEVKNSCDGVLYIEIYSDKKEDESYLKISSLLDLKSMGSKKYRAKAETTAAILDLNPKAKGAFQSTQSMVRKMVAHQLVQLYGKKSTQTQIVQTVRSQNNNHLGYEPYLEVEGVTNFQKLQNFKNAYAEVYPQYPLEERVIKPGIFKFAVKGIRGGTGETNISVAQIVSKIKNSQNFLQRNIRIEVSQLKPASADEDEVVVVAIK